MSNSFREGSLEAPTRHPLNWKDAEFYNEASLMTELERVYDMCDGCRRCLSLCNAFPTLFDLADATESMEVSDIDKKDYWKVVDHCYLCDLCFLTKCPYVPPHEWNLDFPHVMLRAKAVKFKKSGAKLRDKILSSTDAVSKIAGLPIIRTVVNKANSMPSFRVALQSILGVHSKAKLPPYASKTLRKSAPNGLAEAQKDYMPVKGEFTNGRVAIFATCYGNYNEPDIGHDLIAVLQHNNIEVCVVNKEQCCGMPKLELGDLEAVEKAKDANVPMLAKYVEQGWDIIGPVPSCVLMFKQELPLMFPDDEQVEQVKQSIFDPFEYLMLRNKEGLLKTDFNAPLGDIAYQVACHQRVQNFGLKTRDALELVPMTNVHVIERCSGHDGTYAVKKEFHDVAMKIVEPVANKVIECRADYYTSDCAMAGRHIENALNDGSRTVHPISLFRKAYGI